MPLKLGISAFVCVINPLHHRECPEYSQQRLVSRTDYSRRFSPAHPRGELVRPLTSATLIPRPAQDFESMDEPGENLAAIVAVQGLDQPWVNSAALARVFQAEPAVVLFHALHVLREHNPSQRIQQHVRPLVEERTTGRQAQLRVGHVLLNKDVRSRQRTERRRKNWRRGKS